VKHALKRFQDVTAEINAVHVDALDDRFVTFRKMQQDCT
jgi:hypothetical protein